MVKSITNKNNFNIKNVKNSNTITSDIKTGQIIATNATITTATITNLNNSQVSTNTSNISTNAANIATNTSNISTNAANITTLQTTTATNTADIATNTSNISTNAADISTNASNISTNTADIATNTSNISTNAVDISTNASNISTNTANITTLQTTTATNTADIATNTSNISTNAANIATNTSNISTNAADIATNTSNISTNTADIATKQDTLEAGDIITMGNLTIDQPGATNATFNIKNSTTGDIFRIVYNTDSNSVFIQKNDDGGGMQTLLRITTTETRFNTDIDLNTNNILNGGSGAFSSISLNTNDLQDLIDAKAADFIVNSNALLMDAGAFPLRELKFLYNSTYFNINASNELNLNGVLPTLTSNLNLGNNNITNGGDITVDDITSDNITNNVNISTSTLQATTINPPSDYPTNAILRHCSFNTSNANATSSGNYGSNSYLNGFVSSTGDYQLIIGNNAITKTSNGIFTINAAGTYKITVSITGDNANVNDRVVLGFYLSLNNTNTNWQTYGDSMGTMYLRDDNLGQSGNCSFSSVRTYAESDTIRIKTKYGQGNNTWNETRNDADIDIWANITFEKLF